MVPLQLPMRRFLGVLLLAGLSLLTGGGARPAAPPPRVKRAFTLAEQLWLQGLPGRVQTQAVAGRFAEALALLREALSLREKAQGKNWEAVMLRYTLEPYQRLARLPARERTELGQAFGLLARAEGHGARGAFEQAERDAREAVRVFRKVLGDEHADTANALSSLANLLVAARKFDAAREVLATALTIYRNTLGEHHPMTAAAQTNIGQCLEAVGRPREALPLLERALAVYQRCLGEDNPTTAVACNALAHNCSTLGQTVRARGLLEKSLAIRLRTLGPNHPSVSRIHLNLARTLLDLGEPVEATRQAEHGVRLCRQVIGANHPETAWGVMLLAQCLLEQGQPERAQLHAENAVIGLQKTVGERHPLTVAAYNVLGLTLNAQGRHALGQVWFQRALATARERHGEFHTETATCYNNLAHNLTLQGKHAAARPLLEQALTIDRRLLGEEHPALAAVLGNLANNLQARNDLEGAEKLLELAYCLQKRGLGESHPRTVQTLGNLAAILNQRGKFALAQQHAERALALGRDSPRIADDHPQVVTLMSNLAFSLDHQGQHHRAGTIFHAAFRLTRQALGENHPRLITVGNNLAANLWQRGRRAEAVRLWQTLISAYEAARIQGGPSGLDRELASPFDVSPHAALAATLPAFGCPRAAFRHAERLHARGLLDDLAAQPAAADSRGLHQRREGLDRRLRDLLGRPNLSPEERRHRESLLAQRRNVLAELATRASERSASLVLPAQRIQQSIPSDAALVLWLDVKGLDPPGALILRRRGVPVWQPLPGTGKGGQWTPEDTKRTRQLLIAAEGPTSSPAELRRLTEAVRRQRLDPLRPHLRASGTLPAVRRLIVVPSTAMNALPVEILTDEFLVSYIPSGSVYARLMEKHRRLSGNTLLAVGDPVFAHAEQAPPAASKHRLTHYEPLPGTRREVEALARLVPDAVKLVGSVASEQSIDQLNSSGKLANFRLIHLATHGEIDPEDPLAGQVILSRDRLPDPAQQLREGKKVYTGAASAATILRDWKLNADLVVLSACRSGLGRPTGGEGLLGFAQILLLKGARSVVLSRWKVDDTATALLMVRFYENLLGNRQGMTTGMGRAEALAEAKRWLRDLPRQRAAELTAGMSVGLPRGTEGPALPSVKKPVLPEGARPYAHPYFWAAFVLIGDPE
jgi:CHAT domain-containing protein/tetratricopeptide (TPR) repeat protein